MDANISSVADDMRSPKTTIIDSTSFNVTNNDPGNPDAWLGCLSPPTGSPQRCSMDTYYFGHAPVPLNVTESYST
jgi:hypothetical protein